MAISPGVFETSSCRVAVNLIADACWNGTGFDLAGEVVKVGAGVSDFRPGDKVIAINFPVRSRDPCGIFLTGLDHFTCSD
jgi:threonine dehydrogenase-like Zn-dependent dehydrogenase